MHRPQHRQLFRCWRLEEGTPIRRASSETYQTFSGCTSVAAGIPWRVRYLNEFAWKRSIERDARALKALDPFVGDVWLDCVHNESFKAYIDTRHRHPSPDCKRVAAGTINRDLAVARRILNLSARLWRDEGSTLTWLAEAPLIQLLENRKARKPYPIDWSEQQLLFSELTPHLRRAALFKVNTGTREKEVCQLRWEWERRVPELDTPEIERTVFVLPK